MLLPPHKKMKLNLSPPPSSSPLLSLPEDVAMNCLARFSRSDQAALCAASKSCRSLVASPYLYKTRSLMGRIESSVYVCIRAPPPGPSPRWYILRRRKSSSDLIPIPSLPSQAQEASSVVVVDWGIYVIGGLTNGKPTSDVFLLDCRTHKWRQVPSMKLPRANAAAGVVDGKIYVLGGCKVENYSQSGEVFDPKTQTWDSLPRLKQIINANIHDSFVSDHKVYAGVGTLDGTDRTYNYSPREGKWGRQSMTLRSVENPRDWCMIGDLLCWINRLGIIYWREPEGFVTKKVKGLESLTKNLSSSRLIHFDQQTLDLWEQYSDDPPELEDLLPGARLTNSGPNMLLFWSVHEGDRFQIFCAEISLERRGDEVQGNIESLNVVLTVDPFLYGYKVLYTATVLV